MKRDTHNAGQEIGPRLNFGGATRGQSAIIPGSQAVVESTPPRPGHALHQWPCDYQRVHTTVQTASSHHSTQRPASSHYSTASELTPLYDQRAHTTLATISELTPLYDQRAHITLQPVNSHHSKLAFTLTRPGLPGFLTALAMVAFSLINNYANALHWIMPSNYGAQLLHYLDDFLLVGPPSKECSTHQHSSFTCPPDKLEQLTGNQVLAIHHQEGIALTHRFLPSGNGVAMFLEPDKTEADSLQLFTDASCSLGFGTYFNSGWFRGDWQPHQCLPLCTIQWQELFTIVAAASTWDPLWTGRRIHFHCKSLSISRPGQDSPRNSLNSCNCSKPCVHSTYTNSAPLSRDLNYHVQLLLAKAVVPSMATTPLVSGATMISVPVLPGTKEMVTLFAAHFSLSLHSKTIRNPMLSLSSEESSA
ncbi:hypothetical protein EMCRGX_G030401 [Ephydatia muelleri]